MHALSAMPVGETLDMGFPYPPGYEPELNAEEVFEIQIEYFVERLNLLEDKRASSATCNDIIDWIAVPLVLKNDLKNLPVVSFQLCCYAYGVDPETLQESILRIVAPNRLAVLGYE